MSVVGRSGIHVLVSEGWNNDEGLLEWHVEHPAVCNSANANVCDMQELLHEIDYLREPYLHTPGRYMFRVAYLRDYWGEYDIDLEVNDIPDDIQALH